MTIEPYHNKPPYELWVDGFAPRHFHVHSLSGKEAISKAWSFDVIVTASEDDEAEKTALGRQSTLVFNISEKPRAFFGFIAAVRIEEVHAADRAIQYKLRVVPRLWSLKRKRRSRVFQNMDVPHIVSAVLLEAGIESRWRLTRAYPLREYCTQYEETDYRFVSRLLAEAGIFFYFSHGPVPEGVERAGGVARGLVPADTVICADDPTCYPAMNGDDEIALAASTAVALAPGANEAGRAGGAGGAIASETGEAARDVPVLRFFDQEVSRTSFFDKVLRFRLRNTMRSSSAVFRDYDPERPMVPVWSTTASTAPFPPSTRDVVSVTEGESAQPAGESAIFDVYEHHGNLLFPKREFAKDEASRVLRRARRKASIAVGESGCSDLSPGHRFLLREHPAPQVDGEYVVSHVEHHGEARPQGAGSGRVYSCLFECAPAKVAIVPPRLARRSARSTLTATVVGPNGSEIHVNEKGQIKVQFHWDREARYDDNSSCWIRVMQPWAGAGWGHQFIPRVGMEVVVVFEGDDPDKPMVIGTLYNGTHPPPFKLPEGKARSGIKTQSSPGGGGFNELSFEDAATKEQIYVHAQRDMDVVIERNHTLLARNDELIRVLGSRVDRIEKHLEEHVGGDHKTSVGGNRIDVVDGSSDQRVSGALTTRVEGKERREVYKNADFEYAEDLTVRVLGCMTTLVGKSTKKRTWITHAEGTAALSGLDRVSVGSEKEVILSVGKSSIRVSSDRIELHSPSIAITGEGGAMSVAEEGLAFRSGERASIELGKKLIVKTEGASLSMEREVKIDGEKILLNSPEQAKDPPPKDPAPLTGVEIVDQDGNALAYQRFVVRLDDGTEIGGKTGSDGKAELDLPRSGKVIFSDLSMPGDESVKGELVPHVVAQGEYLAKLAFIHGFDADEVWNDPKNEELKTRRSDPNILAPGDVLHIPSNKKEGELILQGQSNRYEVKLPKIKLELVFRDGDQPFANELCEVHGLGAPAAEEPKRTDGDGKLALDVPVTTREVSVAFPEREGMTFHFYVGDMDPLGEGGGVVQRLLNLGYLPVYFKEDADREAEMVKTALAAFQAENGLDPTGELDEATKKALLDNHQA